MATVAAATPDPALSATRLRQLERAFWAVWALFPVMLWIAFRAYSGAAEDQELLARMIACGLPTLQPDRFSVQGKIVWWTYFAFNISIYIVILVLTHRMVHRFARGRALAHGTLLDLSRMGWVLVVWPFLVYGVDLLVNWVMATLGDLPADIIGTGIDVGPIAVGLLLVALRPIIAHAMRLQAEQDLTI